jgi:hypothetical protein
MICYYAECSNNECRILFIVLSVVVPLENLKAFLLTNFNKNVLFITYLQTGTVCIWHIARKVLPEAVIDV